MRRDCSIPCHTASYWPWAGLCDSCTVTVIQSCWRPMRRGCSVPCHTASDWPWAGLCTAVVDHRHSVFHPWVHCVEDDLWQLVIIHTYHVTSPVKLCCSEECFNAGNITAELKDFSVVGFLILPAHTCYSSEATRIWSWSDFRMWLTSVQHPAFWSVEKWSGLPLCKLRPAII